MALAAGALVGTPMNFSCLAAVQRDFAHPDLGWGVFGLLWLQMPALALVVGGLCALPTWRTATGALAWRAVLFATLGLAYVLAPLCATTWNNGCC